MTGTEINRCSRGRARSPRTERRWEREEEEEEEEEEEDARGLKSVVLSPQAPGWSPMLPLEVPECRVCTMPRRTGLCAGPALAQRDRSNSSAIARMCASRSVRSSRTPREIRAPARVMIANVS